MTDKCIVHGCQNHKHQGTFEGDLCAPCHRMLTTGEPKHGTTFVHDMEARILADADRIEELEAEVARLREALGKALERLEASAFTNSEHAQDDETPRAALAEQEKDDE